MSEKATAVAYETGTHPALVKAAMEKKLAHAGMWALSADREARTLAFIRKHTDLPFVAFEQGFGAGSAGYIAGLPDAQGIEPALSDLRLERVYQNKPAQVHIEVSGSDWQGMSDYQPRYIKLEKLRQQQRTGDDKLIMLVYENYRRRNGEVKPTAIMLAIPPETLELSGTIADLQQRYPERGNGLQVVQRRGQWMLAIPPHSEFELTRQQFIARIEQSLNRGVYDR